MNSKKAKLLRKFAKLPGISYNRIKHNYTKDSVIGRTVGSRRLENALTLEKTLQEQQNAVIEQNKMNIYPKFELTRKEDVPNE